MSLGRRPEEGGRLGFEGCTVAYQEEAKRRACQARDTAWAKICRLEGVSHVLA